MHKHRRVRTNAVCLTYGAIKTRVDVWTKKGQPALHIVKGVMGWTGGAAGHALLPGKR
jgi:hypothetical protein